MMKKIIVISGMLALMVSAILQAQEETFMTVKKRIRVTDGIARGENRQDALEKAIENAKRKALERVATSFFHSYERTENAELTAESIAQDIHAKILSQTVRKVEYPFDNVALVTVEFVMQYFDLDFFIKEMRKSAESSLMRSLVCPGWGQLYNRNYINALVCFSTWIGSGMAWLYYDSKTDRLNKLSQAAVPPFAQDLDRQFSDASAQSSTWKIIFISTWVYSLWEAFEDREITNEKLDVVHDKYFPEFNYYRYKSFVQQAVDRWLPGW